MGSEAIRGEGVTKKISKKRRAKIKAMGKEKNDLALAELMKDDPWFRGLIEHNRERDRQSKAFLERFKKK